MLFDVKEVKAFLADFVENEAEYKEVIQDGIKIIEAYAPELKGISEGFTDYVIKQRIKAFFQYCNAGLSRKEALCMVLNSKVALTEAMHSINNKK